MNANTYFTRKTMKKFTFYYFLATCVALGFLITFVYRTLENTSHTDYYTDYVYEDKAYEDYNLQNNYSSTNFWRYIYVLGNTNFSYSLDGKKWYQLTQRVLGMGYGNIGHTTNSYVDLIYIKKTNSTNVYCWNSYKWSEVVNLTNFYCWDGYRWTEKKNGRKKIKG